MSKEELILKGRLEDLAAASYTYGKYTFTDFLGIAEYSVYSEMKRELEYAYPTESGGAEGCERVVVRFGDEDCHNSPEFPISVIKISPKSPKFSSPITHRDILGALMSLGVERDGVGDIIVGEGECYVFVLDKIRDYILENLTDIARTRVIAEISEQLPKSARPTLKTHRIQASSDRADGIVSKVFSLSREDAQKLFSAGRIFVSGRLCEAPDSRLKEGDIVTVRGKGRFIYHEPVSTSRKGKLNFDIELFT